MFDFICFNGEILPEKGVRVSPLNRGMMYGDGCFETFRSYSGNFLGFDHHFQRLTNAFSYLSMDVPFSNEVLRSLILELISVNDLEKNDTMIRIQCWRKGGRGYKTGSRECDWLITSDSLPEETSSPLRLVSAQTPVIPTQALKRDFKLSNGLNYIIAAEEARKQNTDDALMLTTDKFVSETTIANIFWGIENRVFTPSMECDVLSGVTRSLVIDVIRQSDLKIEEGCYSINDLKSSEFAFTTNSLSEIRPVQSIDDSGFDVRHPSIKKIQGLFEEFKMRELS